MGSVKRVFKEVRKIVPDSMYIYVFRLSPRYYLRGPEDFGESHNKGFKACIE